MIQVTIDLDKIPKDKIWTGKNGGKKLFATLAERRETTQYGETHTLYLYDKDTKEKTYIGSGKVIEFKERTEQPNNQPNIKMDKTYDDRLPF